MLIRQTLIEENLSLI